MSRSLRAIAAGLAFAAFAVALVAFGGRALAWVVVSTALAAAVAAMLLVAAGSGMTPRRSVVIPALALIALSGVSVLRLPPRLVETLSPKRHAIARAVHDASPLDRWVAAARGSAVSVADVLDETTTPPAARPEADAPVATAMPWLPVAFDPPAARVAWAVLACWLAFLLALSAQPERTGLRLLSAACALTAPMALYAMIWLRIGNGRIYSIFAAPPNVLQQPFGPFWNANHFAALLAMTGLMTAAATLSPDLQRWIRGVAALAALPLLAGVVDAGSRGGLMGLGAGVALLGLLLVVGRRRVMGLAVIAAAVAGVLVAFVVLPERLIGESLPETVTVGEMGSNFERARIYDAEGAMARSAPLVGIGIGSFRTAYPAFQEGPTTLAPIHGESDWLETLSEGGLPLVLAWIFLVAGLVAPALRVVRRGQAPVLLMGLVAALGAVLVHASVDFHLREPSVALVAVVIGATAHAWARRLETEPGAAASDREPRWTPGAAVALALLGAAGCVVLARVVPWDAAMRSAELAFAKGEIASAREAALRATQAAPERGASWALLAASEEQLARVVEPKERARRREAALDAAVEALRRDPSALGAARIAAQALVAAGALPEALQAARLAILVAPGQAAAHRVLGEALLLDDRGDEALEHLAFALEAMPSAQLAAQAPLLTRLIRDAGEGDPARIFGAVTTRRARITYVHHLQRAHHEAEIGAYLRVVLSEGVPAEQADDWSYGLVGNSPEAVELARALLKDARSPVALTRIGRTLAQAGDPEGRAMLEQILARDDAPALVFEVLVTILKGEGRREEAHAMALRGAERHPENPGFAAIARSLEAK